MKHDPRGLEGRGSQGRARCWRPRTRALGALSLAGKGDLELSKGILRGHLAVEMQHRSRLLIGDKGLAEAEAPNAAFLSCEFEEPPKQLKLTES